MTESAAGQSETFTTLFQQAVGGNDPLPYQTRLAVADPLPSLLDVPRLGEDGCGSFGLGVASALRRRSDSEADTSTIRLKKLQQLRDSRVRVQPGFRASR